MLHIKTISLCMLTSISIIENHKDHLYFSSNFISKNFTPLYKTYPIKGPNNFLFEEEILNEGKNNFRKRKKKDKFYNELTTNSHI